MKAIKVHYERIILFCYQVSHLSLSQWNIEKLQMNTLGSYRQQKTQ
jgi:hypothetical protein